MAIRIPLAVLGGSAVGAAACYFYLHQEQALPTTLTPGSLHRALRYGAPSANTLIYSQNLVTSFNSRLRNPDWVLEVITEETCNGTGTREALEFFEEPALQERFRNRLADFKGSPYDRGHLAPAANHRGSHQSIRETFALSNISPQVGRGFNRDFWARFERYVRGLPKRCSEVRVLTGPLYLPMKTPSGYILAHAMLGEVPRLVGVPTHFFKIILAEPKDSTEDAVLGAFVMPNAAIDPRTPLALFSVPVAALEEAAGFEVFPEFLTDSRREALAQSAVFWQLEGLRQLHAVDSKILPIPEPALLLPPQSLRSPVLDQRSKHSAPPASANSGSQPSSSSSEPLISAASDAATRPHPSLAETASSQSMPATAAGQSAPPEPVRRPRGRPRGSRSNKPSLGSLPAPPRSEISMAQAAGVQHICDFAVCNLPPVDWFLQGSEKKPVAADVSA